MPNPYDKLWRDLLLEFFKPIARVLGKETASGLGGSTTRSAGRAPSKESLKAARKAADEVCAKRGIRRRKYRK